jgi:hypothetical protein
MNPGMSLPCPAPLPNTNDQKAMEESVHPLFKKRKPSISLSQNQAPSKKETFPSLSSEDTTTEATFQSESTTKAQA